MTGHKAEAQLRRNTDRADHAHLAHKALGKRQYTTEYLTSAFPF